MNIDLQYNLAQNLKALRQNKKLSQSATAEKISVCRSTYCQYELGERAPDLNALCALSDFYHVKVDTLIYGDIQQVISDYFMYEFYGQDELRLLSLFSHLSDFAKGRLLERAEQLREQEIGQKSKIEAYMK